MPLRFDTRLTRAEAPYEVQTPRGAQIGPILAWAQDNGTGGCVITKARNGPGACILAMRFTDEDTAFWFKMRFV